MQQHAASDIGFDLWDEDGLVFDDEPELFVHLDTQPLVFTVRGIRYFGPRFKHLGVDIAAMQSKVDFMIAFNAWMAVERTLILEKVEREATATSAANAHQLLKAIIDGDLEAAENVVHRLEHRAMARLEVVRGPVRE